MSVSVGYCRATTAKTQQFATRTFFKILELPVSIHLLSLVNIMNVLLEYVPDRTVEASASHNFTGREDRDMAVSAVAPVIDRILIRVFRNFEKPFFVEVQCS